MERVRGEGWVRGSGEKRREREMGGREGGKEGDRRRERVRGRGR